MVLRRGTGACQYSGVWCDVAGHGHGRSTHGTGLGRPGPQDAGEKPLAVLLRRVFSERLVLESAVRTWASVDPLARAAVQAIDRRRLGYIEGLLTKSGLAANTARARAQILYWAFLGFAQSDQTLPR